MANMGWVCTPLAGDSPALYVSTPLILPGGKTLDFYLVADADRLLFSDDGLTLFALRGLGYKLDNRNHLRGVSSIAETLGFSLDETGAIVTNFAARDFRKWGGQILRLFSRIIDWEVEHFLALDVDQTLALEVERLMRVKEPTWDIERSPTLNLGNGEQIHFNFRWGTQYVDAVPPNPQAVSFRLRKALQHQRAGGENTELLFILDDRDNEARDAVARELGILSQVARAVRFTEFARAA